MALPEWVVNLACECPSPFRRTSAKQSGHARVKDNKKGAAQTSAAPCSPGRKPTHPIQPFPTALSAPAPAVNHHSRNSSISPLHPDTRRSDNPGTARLSVPGWSGAAHVEFAVAHASQTLSATSAKRPCHALGFSNPKLFRLGEAVACRFPGEQTFFGREIREIHKMDPNRVWRIGDCLLLAVLGVLLFVQS
jgi:hypothetical protein